MAARKQNWTTLLFALVLTSSMAGCGVLRGGDDTPGDALPPADATRSPQQTAAEAAPAPTGSRFSLFPGSKTGAKSGIGVNSYLWRATLDTLSFMPLESVDSQGGVIITDWYANPDAANERFKMNVYILDTRLRADGVKVSVFRQEQSKTGWTDVAVNPETAIQLENQILRRARELKLDTE